MRFSHFNLPAAIHLAEFYDTALHNRLVTYNHSDYELLRIVECFQNAVKGFLRPKIHIETRRSNLLEEVQVLKILISWRFIF